MITLSPRIRATEAPPIPAARAWAARYDWSQVAPQLLDVYRRVAGAAESGQPGFK